MILNKSNTKCQLLIFSYHILQYENYVKTIDFEKATPPSLYYMKQTISNACGTVAMLHSVANNTDVISLDNGILKDFLESTKESTPEERAKQLEENDSVCEVHDNIAREGQTAVRFCVPYSLLDEV